MAELEEKVFQQQQALQVAEADQTRGWKESIGGSSEEWQQRYEQTAQLLQQTKEDVSDNDDNDDDDSFIALFLSLLPALFLFPRPLSRRKGGWRQWRKRTEICVAKSR